MKHIHFTASLLCLLLLAACGKNEETAATEDEQSQTEGNTSSSGNPLTAPVDYLGAVNTANKMANETLELSQVNKALQEYRILEGRNPASLSVLVQEGLLAKEPTAPYGMEVKYNPQTGQVAIVPVQPAQPAGR
jgi:uncharacterized lipoprotein